MARKTTWKMIVLELKKRKQAMIIGAAVGLGIAWYTVSQGIDLQSIADAGKGLFDEVLGRSASPLDMAIRKVYIVFGLIGAAIGYYAELILERIGVLKRRRR